MKRLIALSLSVCLLAGCSKPSVETAKPNGETTPATVPEAVISEEKITDILLSDSGIQVEGENGAVFASNDIVYYEDKDNFSAMASSLNGCHTDGMKVCSVGMVLANDGSIYSVPGNGRLIKVSFENAKGRLPDYIVTGKYYGKY